MRDSYGTDARAVHHDAALVCRVGFRSGQEKSRIGGEEPAPRALLLLPAVLRPWGW